MSATCECGCGGVPPIATRTDRARGYRAGEHRRFIKGHKRATPFDERYEVMPDGCWRWTGYRNPKGYGVVRSGGRVRFAHVVAYEMRNGPVPDGLEIDHLCGNRACVNPDHLEAVTHAENIRRSRVTRLSGADVAAIRESDEDRQTLARRYGVTREYVREIQAFESWVV
jgi:hypothetical protein